MNKVLDSDPTAFVDDLLAEAEEAARAGDGRHAYELSLRATDLAPGSARAWLLRASLAPTVEERVFCVNCMNELAPGFQDHYNVAFFALKDSLDRDPFLAYNEETDHLYRVSTTNGTKISIPKRRSLINVQPAQRSASLAAAQRWLIFAVLGLLFAGIGTLIFAPLAAWAALRIDPAVRARAESVDSLIVVVIAAALFMIGLVFSVLLAIHLIG